VGKIVRPSARMPPPLTSSVLAQQQIVQSHSRGVQRLYQILVDIYHRISAVFFHLVDDFVAVDSI
jgi:hypothetical protein